MRRFPLSPLWRGLIVQLFLSLSFAVTAGSYVTFLLAHGLSYTQVNTTNIVFFSVNLFVELPTGVFADRFGRRKSMIASCWVQMAGLILYGLSTTLALFCVAEGVLAVGRCLASGALLAWTTDAQLLRDPQTDPKRVSNRMRNMKHASLVSAPILGVLATAYDVRLSWFFAAAFMVACLIASIFLLTREGDLAKKHQKTTLELLGMVGTSWKKHPLIRELFIASGMIAIGIAAPNMFWQPFFKNEPALRHIYPLTGNIIGLFLFLGSLVYPLLSKLRPRVQVPLCMAAIGLSVTLCSILPLPLSYGVFLLHEIVRGMTQGAQEGLTNELASTEDRATILSAERVPNHFGALIGLLVSGLLADHVSMRSSWMFCGVILAISGVALLFQERKTK